MINLIADVFPKLRAPKIVLKQISKKFSFRGPFNKQHAKEDQILLKSQSHHLCHISCSLSRQLICRESLLVICKNLRVFFNILTADDKYSLPNRDNLRQPIQMQLSQKQKTFFQFGLAFSKGRLNFEHFQLKDDPHSWCISEITDSAIPGEINV